MMREKVEALYQKRCEMYPEIMGEINEKMPCLDEEFQWILKTKQHLSFQLASKICSTVYFIKFRGKLQGFYPIKNAANPNKYKENRGFSTPVFRLLIYTVLPGRPQRSHDRDGPYPGRSRTWSAPPGQRRSSGYLPGSWPGSRR